MSDSSLAPRHPAVRLGRLQRILSSLLLVSLPILLASCRLPLGEQTLVVVFGDRPVNLDPHTQDRSIAWSVLTNVYDGLVTLSPEMELEPGLAISWETVDPTHWRFTLREGVRFHDGTPLVAEDVAASFRRGLDLPASAVRHYLAGIRDATAEDGRTVVVETAGPLPDLLNRLAFLLIIPAAQASSERLADPVGTGSYRVIETDAAGDILVRAWDGWRGRPAVTSARFTFRADDNAAATALITGEADVCHLLPDDRVVEVAAQPGLRLVQQPRLAVQLLSVHLDRGAAGSPLEDERVRRAILIALDRQGWIDRAFMGSGTVASQLVHPAVLGYDPTIHPPPHDHQAAARLLSEAGFAGGFDVVLTCRPSQIGDAALIAADLAQVGIRVTTVATPPNSAQPSPVFLDYFSWACATGDAADLLNTMVRSRDELAGVGFGTVSALTDPEIDRLLAAADHELDPDRRRTLLQLAQRRAMETLPILPLTVRWGSKGVSDRVEVTTRFDQQDRLADYRWRR